MTTRPKHPDPVPCPMVAGCVTPFTCASGNYCIEYMTTKSRTKETH